MPAKSTFGSASVIPYSSSSSSYKISRSLRFYLAYLSRTPSTASNRKTWTWSGWVKRGALGASSTFGLFEGKTAANNLTAIMFTQDTLLIQDFTASSYNLIWQTASLFRDVSAWYHIVVAYDTTQATSSAAVKLYVNGVQQTLSFLASPGAYAQNRDSYVNSTEPQYIGTFYSSPDYFNGYIAEINFIDGQALDPSSFGYTDSITGSWMPKKYVGTYGTNGFYLPFQNQGNTANYFTYSEDFSNVFWTKYLCTCVTDATTAPNGTNTADKMVINNGQNQGQFYTTGGATANAIWTSSVYLKALDFTTGVLYIQKKDGVFAYIGFDLAAGTVTDGINGATGGTITPVGNGWYRVTCTVNLGTGAGTTFNVNYQFTGNGDGVKGSYIWGAQLEQASSAGPYMYTVASVVNPTLAIGEDRSLPTGGYNNWVATNLSVTSGAGNDSLVDSPTDYGSDTGLGGEVRGNYCTLNPLKTNSVFTLENGNLDFSATSSAISSFYLNASIGVSSGKWYWEVTPSNVGAGPNIAIGIRSSSDSSTSGSAGAFVSGYGYNASGNKLDNSTSAAYGSSYTTSDIIGIALDMNAGTIVFYKNNTSQGTAFSGISGTFEPSILLTVGGVSRTIAGSANFGQRPFAYTAPSGFKALCTTNLITPAIKKGKAAFDAITYNGTGTTFASPSALAFAPDLVWVKSRSQNISHVLSDTVRGVGEVLCSNNTRAASSDSFITNFNQNGFTLNNSVTANNNGSTYVAWAWSRSIIAGMDIVSYTGDGVNARQLSHNLGAPPSMWIVKRRNSAVDWYVAHKSAGFTNYLTLNGTSGAIGAGLWFNSAPTSSFIYLGGTGNFVNEIGGTYIAYLFAEIEGFSKFGSYTGNGLVDGPFVYCGFRPRFLLIKDATNVNNWEIIDTSRDTYNIAGNFLLPNSANAEGTVGVIDILSNGFKNRFAGGIANTNGATVIFAAFAESPFKYARAK